ncbi:hypothetical protein [Ideonella sp. A 288]|uniref:hypothetical protein n=1 Tax=Ideonella sp. A 288 TaxID=1962181 RepID=UPI0011856F2C|nr:hypothetical protein [Ideonella sp. A 288]
MHKKISKHFADFLTMPIFFKNFRDKPPAYFREYMSGEDDCALVADRASKLQTWSFSTYANAVLNEGHYPLTDLALSARCAHATVKFEEAFADAGKNGTLVIENSVFFLSLNILAGWKDEAASIGLSIYHGLDTSLLGLRHTPDHQAGTLYRHFWFLLQLYCDARSISLDTSLYSYPPDMSPYAAVLADWRTTDLDKVQGFVSAMADFHLQHARFTQHDEVAEFDTEDRMLFPHEILSYLRLREWAGLSNPSTFEHPLMHHPMARMPSTVPLPKPETPLLDAVIEKFRTEFPGSFEG